MEMSCVFRMFLNKSLEIALLVLTFYFSGANGICVQKYSNRISNISLMEPMRTVDACPPSTPSSSGSVTRTPTCTKPFTCKDAYVRKTMCAMENMDCDTKDLIKYRTLNGSCNNVEYSWLGISSSPTVRAIKNDYTDGKFSQKSSLPSTRLISTTLFTDVNISDPSAAYMVVPWGQFITHDISDTKLLNSGINCCNKNTTDKKEFENSCAPIDVPTDDPFFKEFNITCLPLERHTSTLRDDRCTKGYGFPINPVTHFMDGSTIYGSDEEVGIQLRTFSGGLMKTRSIERFLPALKNPLDGCPPNAKVCYIAGDTRVNQNVLLAIMHTLFLREHNLIAKELGASNPRWEDDRIFQETRKIVVAIIQHITFNEWLPMIISRDDLITKKILPNKNNEYSHYNSKLTPIIFTEFSTAAFRFLHSGIQPTINLVNDNGHTIKTFNFSPMLFDPSLIEEGNNFIQFLNGLIFQPMGKVDRYCTAQITNFFAQIRRPFGVDLMAIDVERGRDHGIPSYTVIRSKLCGLPEVKTFADLEKIMLKEDVDLLKSLYGHVDDIDLFVGGILETYQDPDRVGPTFKCIIVEQFYRIKYADRFFYDHQSKGSLFTKDQLAEIKKMTLSSLLCKTAYPGEKINLHSFELGSDSNHRVSCDTLPHLNLNHWKETVK